jgi:hypothetical protein
VCVRIWVFGRTYSAIQFWTEVVPLKETTICWLTGSTPTKPLVSNSVPLVAPVSCCLAEAGMPWDHT